MPNLWNTIEALFPTVLTEIINAKRVLAPVSSQPWRDAFVTAKRSAIFHSRLSILPPAFKSSPQFVIDVGANHGQWIGSLMSVLPVREVWIFEPNPEAMKVCKQRIGNHPGVRYFDKALGDRKGQVELHITRSSDFASVLQPRSEFLKRHYGQLASQVVDTRQVEVCTLDSLLPETATIDLLKIDVQGFERAVLTGARKVLENTRAILIEANLQSHYIDDDTFPALWMLLAGLGFSLWNVSPPFLGQCGEALWADAVFVKSAAQ